MDEEEVGRSDVVPTGILIASVLLMWKDTSGESVPTPTFPVKLGDAIFAFKSNAVCWGIDIGLLVSEVLFTLSKSKSDFISL